MDGRVDAEKRIAQLLNNEPLLAQVAADGDGRGQGELRWPSRKRPPRRRRRSRGDRPRRVHGAPGEGLPGQEGRQRAAAGAGAQPRAGGAGAVGDDRDLVERDQVDEVADRRHRQDADRADERGAARPGGARDRGHLARALVPRQQHRDRPEAEDPGDEHLEERARRHARGLRGADVGPEPDLPEGLHRRILDVRRRALRLPDRRLRVLEPPEGRRPAAQPVGHLRLGAHALHRRRLAAALPHGQLAGAAEPAGPAADRLEPGLCLLAVAARERGQPATSA